MKYNWPYSGPCLLHTAEGGTSGKNTSTDQKQIQATSQEGQVIVSEGSVNTGLSIGGAATFNVTDAGAIDRAFDFGEAVLLNQASTSAETVRGNNEFLAGITGLIASNSAGGATESQNKLTLYLGAGLLAIVALIFLKR